MVAKMKFMTVLLISVMVHMASTLRIGRLTSSHQNVDARSYKIRLDAHAAPVCTEESFRETVVRALKDTGVKKSISLLGSTGSIGTQTLDICREFPDQFQCVAMAAGGNLDLLASQVIIIVLYLSRCLLWFVVDCRV